MNIPIAKPMIDSQEVFAAERVLRSGQLAAGAEVVKFEAGWAKYQDSKWGVAVTSGTTALEAAIAALPRHEGEDEIIVPAMSFNATSSAVVAAGYRPVFVDVKDSDLTMDPVKALNAVGKRTRAIIPVHLHGQMADMDQLDAIGVDIIEDAAQAHDSYIEEYRPGGWTTVKAVCFSFYATKAITTGGEGGMVLTDDYSMYQKLRLLREHGSPKKYEHESLGHNWRMTEMQAAIGNVQLTRLPEFQEKRHENADRYKHGLSLGWKTPWVKDNHVHSWHQYVVRTVPEYRDELIRLLNSAGIGTGVHYPIADPQQVMYGYRPLMFPVAEYAAKTMISLPVGPWVTKPEIDYIIESANNLMEFVSGIEWDR